jgi:Zn-dependent protease
MFSWKLGRVLGIDLYLHPTFLLLLLFVGLNSGGLPAMAMVVALFGCVLLHELGHALAGRLYGIPTVDITLYPIGGVARLTRMPSKPGPELVIALAGPAVNLGLAGSFAAVAALAGLVAGQEPFGMLVPVLGWLTWMNLALAAFNLIPAFPMDGGRVLRALLSGWLGRLRATEIAAGVGKLLAIGFGVWSLTQGMWLQVALAVFVWFVGQRELARVRHEEGRHPVWSPSGVSFAGSRERWVPMGHGVWRLQPEYAWGERSGEHPSWR